MHSRTWEIVNLKIKLTFKTTAVCELLRFTGRLTRHLLWTDMNHFRGIYLSFSWSLIQTKAAFAFNVHWMLHQIDRSQKPTVFIVRRSKQMIYLHGIPNTFTMDLWWKSVLLTSPTYIIIIISMFPRWFASIHLLYYFLTIKIRWLFQLFCSFQTKEKKNFFLFLCLFYSLFYIHFIGEFFANGFFGAFNMCWKENQKTTKWCQSVKLTILCS